MRKKSRKAEFASRIGKILEKEYGKEVWFPGGKQPDALDTLIGTILTQHTNDANSFPAFEDLKRRFPSWEKLLAAPDSSVAKTISRAGLANIKTKRIKQALREIKERNGGFSLSNVAKMEKEEAKEWLRSLPGVGPKTSAIVLCFSFGMPVMPVDTHIFRVANRLGLIKTKNVDLAHELLEAMVEPEKIPTFHVNMIRHGRQVCFARKPLCWKCVLSGICKYTQKTKKPLNVER